MIQNNNGLFGFLKTIMSVFILFLLTSNLYSQTPLPQQTNAVLGARSVLVIRGVDPATHTWDVADNVFTDTGAELDAYVRRSSFDKAWIGTYDVTPVYEFTVGGNTSYTYMSDIIRDLAIADGYNVSDYNVIIYTYRSTTDLNGAGALGSGNGLNGSVWMPGQLFSYHKGVIHETFHAFGMGHSENIEGGDIMFPGNSTGGHDPYHFMGSEQGDADIPNYMKYMLGWIDPTEITIQSTTPTACETIRIHEASFIDTYDNSKKYSMQLGDDLWVSYVPETENPNMVTHGVLLHHIPNPGAGFATPRIIDTEPASISTLPPGVGSNYLPVIDFWDAAMEVGEEVYWKGAILKVVNTGGTGDEQWVDIEICDCIQESGDSDNDGVCDAFDVCEGFDDTLDEDFDLIPNDCDTCPNDPSNDSNNDNICDNIQCLNKIKEAFDYAIGTDINTANGGIGFDGSWTLTEGQGNGVIGIETGSLSYPNIESATGNKFLMSLNDETIGGNMERTIDPGFTTGEYMWLSTMIKANNVADGGFWIRPDNRQDMAIGKRWGTEFSIDNNGTGIPIVVGETYLLVARYHIQPSQTIVHLWVNPTEADLLDVTTANSTKTVGGGDIESIAVRLERYGAGGYEIDELAMSCNAPEFTGNPSIQIKVFLQGALLNSSDGLMRDDLRNNNLLPTTEPYTVLPTFTHYGNGGGEIADPNLLMDMGNNSIVDWLLVELRDANDSSIIVETQSVLLQKDGQIVDVDGNNQISFNVSNGNYYVSVRHRNHFGVMTQNAINLSGNPLIDFTDINTPTYGINACIDMGNGKQALWAGNCSADNRIIFSGNNNDVNIPFFEVLNAANNTTNITNYIQTAYLSGDVDLNGKVIFQGSNNEQNFIFFNILSYPANSGSTIYVMEQQLPE